MFKELFELMGDGHIVTLNIAKTGDKLAVLLHPRTTKATDEALQQLRPLQASGTPEELDKEFITRISGPLRETTGLFVEVENYEQSLDKVRRKTKLQMDMNEKTKRLLDEGALFEKQNNLVEAVKRYNEVLTLEPNNTTATLRLKEINNKLSQKSLFPEKDKGGTVVETEKKVFETIPIPQTVIPVGEEEKAETEDQPVDMFAQVFEGHAEEKLSDINLSQEKDQPEIEDEVDMFAEVFGN